MVHVNPFSGITDLLNLNMFNLNFDLQCKSNDKICFINFLFQQCGGKNIRLVIMNNLLPTDYKIHFKYDLKVLVFSILYSFVLVITLDKKSH